MNTVIQEILNKNGINESYVKLSTNGIANEIYATPNFILRIPTDHPEAKADAFTESVAAPVAKSNGIKTPELVIFDDSYSLINRTYSIWERIHGFTLGEVDNYLFLHNTWKEIGVEIGKIHVNIKNCDDPKGWLDNPDRDYTKSMMLQGLLNNINKPLHLLEIIENKYTDNLFSYKKCFVHGDTNKFNFLCSKDDRLLSVIDWGDSGWADPAIDFYMIPLDVLDIVLEGYKELAGKYVDNDFIYRIILDKVWDSIENGENISTLENKIMVLESKLLKYCN